MIKLNDRLAIDADKYQYILGTPRERRRNDGEGVETVMLNPTYHSTLSHALHAVIELEMRKKVSDGVIQTLQEYLHQLQAVTRELQDALAQFNAQADNEVDYDFAKSPDADRRLTPAGRQDEGDWEVVDDPTQLGS